MSVAHGYDGLGDYWVSPFGWFEGLLALALTVAFWLLVAMVVVKLVRSHKMSIGTPHSGLRVLEERYARGEITREEFLERRAVLSGEPPPPTTSA